MLWCYLLLHFPRMYLVLSANEVTCNYNNNNFSIPTIISFHSCLHTAHDWRHRGERKGWKTRAYCWFCGEESVILLVLPHPFPCSCLSSQRVKRTRGAGGYSKQGTYRPLLHHNSYQGRMPPGTPYGSKSVSHSIYHTFHGHWCYTYGWNISALGQHFWRNIMGESAHVRPVNVWPMTIYIIPGVIDKLP